MCTDVCVKAGYQNGMMVSDNICGSWWTKCWHTTVWAHPYPQNGAWCNTYFCLQPMRGHSLNRLLHATSMFGTWMGHYSLWTLVPTCSTGFLIFSIYLLCQHHPFVNHPALASALLASPSACAASWPSSWTAGTKGLFGISRRKQWILHHLHVFTT